MTDAEIDALDGVALRKAVAEAVGWEWHSKYGVCHSSVIPCALDDNGSVRLNGWIRFDDAIAACESAQVRHIELFCGDVPQCRVSVEIGWRIKVFDSDGHSPASLCRALLKALAAKGTP